MKPPIGDIIYSAPFQSFLGDLAKLGVEPVDYGGRLFAVIEARSNRRWWLIPLDDRRAATSGLEMLQPVSYGASAAKILSQLITRFGPYGLLGKGKLRLSGIPDLRDAFGADAQHIACFTGTDGPHRKTTLQVMNSDGTILGYAKLSSESHIRPYIRNEALTLERLAQLDLAAVDVPIKLTMRDDTDMTLLITNSRKTKDATTILQPGILHLGWLEHIREQTSQLGAKQLLVELTNQLKKVEGVAGIEWSCRLARALDALRPVADSIPLCQVHGDFTPWNTFVQHKRLYIFDWEYANPAWPVGYDLVHFLLATIPPVQQAQHLSQIEKTLISTQFQGNERAGRRSLLLSLLCHALLYLLRVSETEGALDDWGGNFARAQLIEAMLEPARGGF